MRPFLLLKKVVRCQIFYLLLFCSNAKESKIKAAQRQRFMCSATIFLPVAIAVERGFADA